MKQGYKMVATTLFGLEAILAQELKQIKAQKVEIGNRCVHFFGDKKLMYLANLKLRTALKILKPISHFKAEKEKDLYYHVSKIKWTDILDVYKTFSITSTVNSTHFTHSNYVALLAKDAIVDQFRKKKNERPSINIKNPDININIHISDNRCDISLNSSGHSLHKRGYRTQTFIAPLNEVLAAGIVMLSNWDSTKDFINPMCGSGTILIEAALIAINRAPNIYRKCFNFQNWKNYDEELYNDIKLELKKEEHKCDIKLYGSDISASAISIARQHIEHMELDDIIEIEGKNFFKSSDIEKDSIIFLNPPYGKRIELKKDYYKEIGDTLKQLYTGTCAWMISSEMAALKTVGLKPSKKIKLFNGALECKLLQYDLYEGSKKIRKLLNEQEVKS
jgi:putative N6-adenine-specific DNA methylase